MTSIGRKDLLEKMSGKLQAISCAFCDAKIRLMVQKSQTTTWDVHNPVNPWDKLSINWCRISEPSTETVPKKLMFIVIWASFFPASCCIIRMASLLPTERLRRFIHPVVVAFLVDQKRQQVGDVCSPDRGRSIQQSVRNDGLILRS